MIYLKKEEILKKIITEYNFTNKNILILVGGCSRSGKSTFVKILADELKKNGIKTITISADNWIVPAKLRKKNSTVMHRFRIEEIINSINTIQNGKSINFIPYNHLTRELDDTSCTIQPPTSQFVIILDGVIALCIKELLEISKLKIYIEISDLLRIKRLIKFYRDKKNLSKHEYNNIIKNREKEEVIFVKSSSSNADIIIKY